MGGFLSSIEGNERRGRKHVYDPPSGYMPPINREQIWKSTSKYVAEPNRTSDQKKGRKLVENLAQRERVEDLGWTGKFNNYTGPRHYDQNPTSLRPDKTTKSFYVENMMGTKKAVLSKDMGLKLYYEDDERRCQRPATEWSLESLIQRKIRVPDLEDRRNGIGVANPGDKGYGTADHAPEYAAMLLEENKRRGNMSRKVMSTIGKSWSQSSSDVNLDKKGRRMSDYIQIYCKTPYRKNSMYVHRNATTSEIADLAGEGGSRKFHILFKGKIVQPHHRLLELGIRAKSTVELILEPEVTEHKMTYFEKENFRMIQEDVETVKELTAAEARFPSSEEQNET
uniref:Ubiquitin-like domain-containing protein n=1 Tax=Hanusia phi TaxID=3032 RepID=A0A7S0I4F4_9CRYP